MRATYNRFVRRVAAGRSAETAQIEEIAEGRIWSGRRALELGLVDRYGGLRAAIALARTRAQLDDDAPVEEWPRRRSVVESMAQAIGGNPSDEVLHGFAAEGGPVGTAAAFAGLLRGEERVLTALPIFVEIQ
jgi:protease-4